MEAEKLKAVEAAVEEERRRVAGRQEEERAAMAREREEVRGEREAAWGEREAVRLLTESARAGQARQADMVNRLQVSHTATFTACLQ
jgi:hypothetical protein